MKKLLFILLILLLGAAAILYIAYSERRTALQDVNSPPLSRNAEEETAVSASETESAGQSDGTGGDEVAASAESSGTDIRNLLDKLAEALPELDALQKEILLPQLVQWVEDGKALPEWLITQLEESGLTLKDLPGDSFGEKLNRFIRDNREKVLEWLQTLREE